MAGKRDERTQGSCPGRRVPAAPAGGVVAGRLDRIFPGEGLAAKAARVPACAARLLGAGRDPHAAFLFRVSAYRLDEGPGRVAGARRHRLPLMASWMDRDTSSLIQMGGEGVNWAASSLFTGHGHIFQNLGEGTWYHSGSMAIRQAIAAGANITYKILYNDAVAMTGGQPVDGP